MDSGSGYSQIPIDRVALRNQIKRLVEYVHDTDLNDLDLDFKDRDGVLKSTENYKSIDVIKARSVLNYSTWTESVIGTGLIGSLVIKAINKCYNLVDNHSITDLKNLLDATRDEYNRDAELALYRIYKSDDEKASFDFAKKIFGGQYDLMACLFFIKDENRFLPIRSSNFDKRFEILNIDFRTSGRCSWENYTAYINLIRSIGKEMSETMPLAHKLRLLDAHSFVWIIGKEDYKNWIPNNEKCVEEALQIEEEIVAKELRGGEETYSYVKTRVNQGAFRKELLKRHHACDLCGMDNEKLLIASHIKPWSESNKKEKTDADNGFMLCPNHDKLFDEGYISFTDSGEICISSRLSDDDRILLNVSDSMTIVLTEGNKKYIEYHRNHKFKR